MSYLKLQTKQEISAQFNQKFAEIDVIYRTLDHQILQINHRIDSKFEKRLQDKVKQVEEQLKMDQGVLEEKLRPIFGLEGFKDDEIETTETI